MIRLTKARHQFGSFHEAHTSAKRRILTVVHFKRKPLERFVKGKLDKFSLLQDTLGYNAWYAMRGLHGLRGLHYGLHVFACRHVFLYVLCNILVYIWIGLQVLVSSVARKFNCYMNRDYHIKT
jgi:hypothetical protein